MIIVVLEKGNPSDVQNMVVLLPKQVESKNVTANLIAAIVAMFSDIEEAN